MGTASGDRYRSKRTASRLQSSSSERPGRGCTGTGKANTLLRMSVGPDGLTVVDQHALTGGGHSQFVQGRADTTGGYVIDPEVPSALGRLGSAGNYPWTVAEDVANGFVYGALDRTTAVVVSEDERGGFPPPTQSVELPSERWADGRLCVVGAARLAFRSKPAVWFVDRVTFFDFNGPARRTVRIESAAPSAGARVAVVPPGTGGASVITLRPR